MWIAYLKIDKKQVVLALFVVFNCASLENALRSTQSVSITNSQNKKESTYSIIKHKDSQISNISYSDSSFLEMNGIAGIFDTLVATKYKIKGLSSSKVGAISAPQIKKLVKPEYTREMLIHKIEGEIKLKVFVDIDGKVKKAIPINDLGFGAIEAAAEAIFAMEFEPAKHETEKAAVWILIPIRFVLVKDYWR